MRISRGLNTLLWWTSAFAVASPHDVSRAPVPKAVGSRGLGEDRRHVRDGLLPRRMNLFDKQQAFSQSGGMDDACNDGDSNCEGFLLGKRDVTATAVVTQTVVKTVTVASQVATTVVISTVSQTLTVIDPALKTQTRVMTVTAPGRNRRRIVSLPETALNNAQSQIQVRPSVSLRRIPPHDNVASDKQRPEITNLERRQAEPTVTVTSTRTIERTTTVNLEIVTVTRTIFNTVFVTQTIAPSASTTVIATTTIRQNTPNEIPGGLIEPTGGATIFPENPDLLPPGSLVPPGGTLLPPDAPSNPPLTSGTPLPSGITTGVLPPGNPQTIAPPSGTPTETPPNNEPSRPFPGSSLSSDQIAGIVLGVIFGIFFILLAAFLIRRFRKQRKRDELAKNHQDMAAAAAAGGPLAAGALVGGRRADGRGDSQDQPPTGGPSDSSSGPTGEGEVRIVIRPAPKRRTQSSGLLPPPGQRLPSTASGSGESSGQGGSGIGRGQWPRPPGYTGQTYSFFVEESGETTPQDPGQWSVASEYGSNSAGASVNRQSAAYASTGSGGVVNPQYPSYSNYSNYSQDEPVIATATVARRAPPATTPTGNNGAQGGGSDFLSVGRALSPWKPI